MEQLKEIQEFIKKAVDDFKTDSTGCYTYKLDDRLAICVGWLSGYDVNDDDVIHSQTEPEFAVNAGIKVYTSDDMLTDYEFINMPYYQNGEVLQTDVSISPDDEKDNYEHLAQYLLKEYENMKDLNIDEDGLIHEDAPVEEKEDESLNENDDEPGERHDDSSWMEDYYNIVYKVKGEDEEHVEKCDFMFHDENLDFKKIQNGRPIEEVFEYWYVIPSYAKRPVIKDEKDIVLLYPNPASEEIKKSVKALIAKEKGVDESLTEETEEPKLETYEEQIEFLVKDEDEAIAGYDKVLALVDDENVKEQLQHLKEEEVAHKEFLEKLKTDKTAKYEHEEEAEVTNTEEVITNVEESCKVNETFAGEDVINDLVDRAKMKIDEGEDIDEAVRDAIDEGLIYTKDIYSLLEHYGTIEDSTITESYYDELYSDVYNKVTNKDEASDDEEDDDDHFSDDDTIYY